MPAAKAQPPARAPAPLPMAATRPIFRAATQVVAMFGPPGVGISTMARVLHGATFTPTTIVTPDFGDLMEAVANCGTRVAFIDGFPRSVEGVQYLYDQRLVTPAEGLIVRVFADTELILRRAAKTTPPMLGAFHEQVSAIEAHIQRLALQGRYTVIPNDDLETAVGILARRIGGLE
jgi:hypothetical protein